MKTYTVKEISELLNTNPETVRRWIRSGKLKAVQGSRKGGNAITEDALQGFLKNTPKYASIAASSLSKNITSTNVLSVAIGSVIGGILGAAAVEFLDNEEKAKNAQISSESIAEHLKKSISQKEESIQRKQDAIKTLEDEIEEERRQIEMLQKTIVSIEENRGEEE